MRATVRKFLVVGLILGPCVALSVTGAWGLAATSTAWEDAPADSAGAFYPVNLDPDKWYTVAVETACFSGSNYTVLVMVWDNDTGDVLHLAQGSLFVTRTGCRSWFETREFRVGDGRNLTVEWNLSSEVMAHGARLRLVARAVSMDDSLEMLFLGPWIGLWLAGVALMAGDWFAKRPPKRPRDPERAPSPSGGVAATG